MTLIVSKVLNGSKGALFYPADEISEHPGAWNCMPIVVNHPEKDGQPVEARDPEILAKQGIGWVFRANAADGPLRSEGWFDEVLTAAYDRKNKTNILARLKAGQPLELSTGLHTENEPAPAGAVFNGPNGAEPYEYVARKYRPDHVAVLPHEKGACSNADGCGVLVNEKNMLSRLYAWLTGNKGPDKSEDTPMDRKATIGWLTTNCSCWKGKAGAKEKLEALDDATLNQLVTQAKLVLVVNAAKAKGVKAVLTRNQEEEAAPGVPYTDLATLLGVEVDPAADPVAFTSELLGKLQEIVGKLGGAAAPVVEEPAVEEMVASAESCPEGEELVDGKCKPKVAMNRAAKPQKQPSLAQYLRQYGTPAERSAWNTVVNAEQQMREGLVRQIVANGSYDTDQERQQDTAELMRLSIDQLQRQLKRQGRQQADVQDVTPVFYGAGGAPVYNTADDDSTNLLPDPWATEAATV